MGCFFNYLYQIYVGRSLGPKEYGIFGSLFAIIYFMAIISGSVQACSAWLISGYMARSEFIEISAILYALIRKTIIFGACSFILFLLSSPFIAAALHLDSLIEVIVLGTILLLSFLLPSTSGVLQGLQKFNSLALVNLFAFFPKLLFGVQLINLGYGVSGALGAQTIGMLIAFIISLFFLKPYLTKRPKHSEVNFNKIYYYSIPTTIVMICLAVPSNLDVIFAKHFFSSIDAGNYAAASVIGKIILFLPSSISIVMMPIASEISNNKKSSANLLRTSMAFTGLLSGIVTLCLMISPQLIEVMFGAGYKESAYLVQIYAIMMFLFTLNWTLAYYCLAINDLKYVYIIAIFTLIEVGLIFYFHNTMLQMIEVMAVANLILLVVSYSYVHYLNKILPNKLNNSSRQ
jgi:O-antigen/teichoic acid export membrane protein